MVLQQHQDGAYLTQTDSANLKRQLIELQLTTPFIPYYQSATPVPTQNIADKVEIANSPLRQLPINQVNIQLV